MAINKFVGAHVSESGGVFNAVKNAEAIGAKALLFLLKTSVNGLGKI